MLGHCTKRNVDLVLVWRLDPAFRSVLDAARTLERLRAWGVGLRSDQEPWLDTTSHFGEARYYITVACAQLERRILRESVKVGMDRARRQGVDVGRPPVTARAGFADRWAAVEPEIRAGRLSKGQAARQLGVGFATVLRLLPPDKGGAAS